MGCQKLSRKCLHLVTEYQGRGLYSLSRMGISSLFYPSTAAAEAAEVEYKEDVVRNLIDVFALLGKSNILCSNKCGYTSIYDTQEHAFIAMPDQNSPKGPRCIATYIARTAAHARSDFELSPKVDYNVFDRKPIGERNDSLHLMHMDQDNPCSFEVLACYPVGNWGWRELPAPPFFGDPDYKAPGNVAFAVVDGMGICVSSATATYLFDTVDMEWRKTGDWVLPFHAKAEYIPELRLWIGRSASRPNDLCALDLSPAFGGSGDVPLPMVQHIGMDVDLPEEWSLRDRTLVNLGSGRLCIVSFFFHIANDAQQVVVFTGVRVVPCGNNNQQGERGHLRLIKHKSKCLITDSIRYVL
ncbi:unnamed protein product [Urochloa decumbens]|uniref:Uncharacterized protein n=1 Tax=Urochloa decumbens TaxID=240449 RepID=A0ABC8W8X9_9POAL